MARKKTTQEPPKFEWKGYVNISIPATHENEVEQYILDDKSVYMDVNTLLVTDYTLKCYFDAKTESFKASITCMNMLSDNGGKMVSAFAGDWYTAIAVLCYKHFHIVDTVWGDAAEINAKKFG